MAEDQNADLIGHSWLSESGITYTVVETWHVMPNYVICRAGDTELTYIRPAAVIRRCKQLTAA